MNQGLRVMLWEQSQPAFSTFCGVEKQKQTYLVLIVSDCSEGVDLFQDRDSMATRIADKTRITGNFYQYRLMAFDGDNLESSSISLRGPGV
jgi:hypothetical protein